MVRKILSLVLAALFAPGCAFGPSWTEIELPAPRIAPARVIVTEFWELKHAVSVTQSLEIKTIREAVDARDMSFDVASGISSAGIPAIAKSEVSRHELAPDEMLLRGALVGRGGGWYRGWPFAFSAVTLFIVGVLFPYPYPLGQQCTYDYRFDLIAPNGEILLSRKDAFHERYDLFVIWGSAQCPQEMEEARRLMIGALATRLTEPSS